ncbi:MAG: penicillin-binding transpeptidase domain-containing protein [Christensenellales bacterium]
MMEPYLRAKGAKTAFRQQPRAFHLFSALAEAQDGETVVLTIDLALQQAAEAALNETMAKIRSGAMGDAFPNAQIGAAVCLDVHSGEVLALASAPGFDPNVFTKALSNTQWQALSPSYLTASGQIDSDPTLPRPLVNNAVCAAFPPGSVFKPITAAAALGAGRVTPQETILDQGRYTAFSQTQAPGCWTWNESHTTHGYVNLHDSLEGSAIIIFTKSACVPVLKNWRRLPKSSAWAPRPAWVFPAKPPAW